MTTNHMAGTNTCIFMPLMKIYIMRKPCNTVASHLCLVLPSKRSIVSLNDHYSDLGSSVENDKVCCLISQQPVMMESFVTRLLIVH